MPLTSLNELKRKATDKTRREQKMTLFLLPRWGWLQSANGKHKLSKD